VSQKGALEVTRRPDTPWCRPTATRGRSQRDLIGARTGEVTPHSIVRVLRVGWEARERDIERSSTDVMMTDVEQKAATEVILGVDTHLDVHVAVALDRLGREAWAR
jgi:hypothetical protein